MVQAVGKAKYLWKVLPQWDGAAALGKSLGIPAPIAQSLFNRGISQPQDVEKFLKCKWLDIIDPIEMHGTDEAAKRIARAISDNEKIVIYGDYDVDGITATAILYECITLLGGQIGYYIPHRMEEGYGINAQAMQEIIDGGAKLVITVDCGISAAAVLAEFSGKVDVVVTDHHTLSDTLPDVAAVVHPALEKKSKPYPNPVLCGAGVAFKLAWQVAREVEQTDRVSKKMQNFLVNATALAALGTIADVVPLLGENRIIASLGVGAMRQVSHIGMSAMAKAFCRKGSVTVRDIAFGVAPRINAAGRMGHASTAVELMTTDSPEVAAKIIKELDSLNEQRKLVEREITDHAVEMVKSKGLDSLDCKVIVLYDDSWHSGVIGIVAARLVDRFAKPVVMIAVDENGRGQGSARSIDGFNIADAFTACSQWLMSHGGHTKAAGLKMDIANIEKFIAEISQYAADNFSDEMLLPKLNVDAQAQLCELANLQAVRTVQSMEPFGSGNAEPCFAVYGCKLVGRAKRMGATGSTLGVMLSQNGTQAIRGVGFSLGNCADFLETQRDVDIVATPVMNTFNGNSNIELQIKDIRPAEHTMDK